MSHGIIKNVTQSDTLISRKSNLKGTSASLPKN